MRWWWQARPGSPGTAQSQSPEMIEIIETDGSDGFVNSLTWTKGAQEYLRARCLTCKSYVGTCRGRKSFEQAKQQHREKCWWPCGFSDCADCNYEPPTVVEYNAA